MKAGKKNVSVNADIEVFLSYFKEKNEEVSYVISGLDGNISDLKKKIKDVEEDLKKKIDDISNKNKAINSKLHDVSGDYEETYLITAAEELKELREQKESIESEFNEILSDLKSSLNELEEEKKENQNIKQNIIDITSLTEKELKETIKSYEKILDTISKAIDICDNPNLKIAYDEESNAKEATLENITNKHKEEVDNVLVNSKSEIPKEEKKEEIEKKLESEIPEIENNNEDLFSNKRVIEIDFEDDKKDIEIPKKVEIDIPATTIKNEVEISNEEDKYDESRKIIDIKTISDEQKIAIENSSIVEKGLENFFE